ncbi:unnamed protein product [Closterium sp. Naga37s-1]|nr:unnamed protein product [Closterium sp. Naga37s-1]
MLAAFIAAFPHQKSHWNVPKVHQIVHLINGIPLRGLPHETSTNLWEHTHKGTVKVPVRGSNWKDIPRRIVEEEVQRELDREVSADAGGGRQYVTALREAVRLRNPVMTKKSRAAQVDEDLDGVMWVYHETHGSDMDPLARCMRAAGLASMAIQTVLHPAKGGESHLKPSRMVDRPTQVHTAVAIPRTRWGELVPKGTFMKASPAEKWFSDVAVLSRQGGEWYARCLCIFRAKGADGEMGRHVYVKYYETEGTCPMTTCMQPTPGRVRTRYAVVAVECIHRVLCEQACHAS